MKISRHDLYRVVRHGEMVIDGREVSMIRHNETVLLFIEADEKHEGEKCFSVETHKLTPLEVATLC